MFRNILLTIEHLFPFARGTAAPIASPTRSNISFPEDATMADDDRDKSDKEKAAQGAARRGEERANGPRGATRASPATKDEARKRKAHDDASAKPDPGRGAGLQTNDPGGADIGPGG